jgi:hypothetical protein
MMLLLATPGAMLITTVQTQGRGPSKDAPFVDARAVRERFDTITPEDMKLPASRSRARSLGMGKEIRSRGTSDAGEAIS